MFDSKEKMLKKKEKWLRKKEILEIKAEIKREKQTFKKKISTSKLLIAFLFLNCTAIEIFTAWSTVQSFKLAAASFMNPDFSPLVTLIGTVVGEIIGYAIYSIKAMKENCEGGIVYMQAMESLNDRIH